MNIKNIFLSSFLASSMLTSIAFADAVPLNKEGDLTVTFRGEYINRKTSAPTSSNFAAKSIVKKNGWGGSLEANYFMTPNMSLAVGAGYQKFRNGSRNYVAGVTGQNYTVSSRYIPIRVGIVFHANSFSGARPYAGVGYEFVKANHKLVKSSNFTVSTVKFTSKKNPNGAYVQAGLNFLTETGMGLNLDVKKSLSNRMSNLSSTDTNAATYKIKYAPLTIGLGVTVAVNND